MSSSPQQQQQQHAVRIYATAYRSITLPGDADFCWTAMSPLTSIASWGCSIVDKCVVDPVNDKTRLVYLVPANPSDVVFIREKCIKNERSPGGEKGTVVFENLVMNDDTTSYEAAASPFPVRLLEMTTTMTISRITTMTSPLGRSFVEFRSSFVVESPEDAATMRNFLEVNLFEPLLHSAAEMLIPCHPFRDAMFHSVMKHFETSIEKMIDAGVRLKATDRVRNSNNNSNGKNAVRHESDENGEQITVSEYTSSAVSVSQEIYSAWLETSRELRRIEKKYEDSMQQMEEWKDSVLLRRPQDQHHMTARYERSLKANFGSNENDSSPSTQQQQHPLYSSKHEQVVAASRKPFDYLNDGTSPHQQRISQTQTRQGMMTSTSSNLPMQDAIALNPNNVFGHGFSSPNNNNITSTQDKNNNRVNRYEKIAATVNLPRPEDWDQEIFDDGEDDMVEQDGGVGDHQDHRFIASHKMTRQKKRIVVNEKGEEFEEVVDDDENDDSNNGPPLPPPRRVLGNK